MSPIVEAAPGRVVRKNTRSAKFAALTSITEHVDLRISELLSAETERWRRVDERLAQPVQDLLSFALSGGKRLRPNFMWWAYLGAGGDPADPTAVDAAAALELLHCFALIHDDVMDGSLQRRGGLPVHLKWSTLHEAEGRNGEARRFGEGVAVLIGDLSFVYADLLMSSAPREAREIFTELRLEVNHGQILDVLGTSAGAATPELAGLISIYKSGKYTVERPLHLGAALAGQLGAFSGALSAYGLPLGEAFQLRDDVLGTFGSAEQTGKPVGEDLREGKPTLLYALARQRADSAQRDVLDRYFARADLGAAGIEALQAVFADSGALALVEERIDRLTEQSIKAISTSGLNAEAISELVAMASYVRSRRV
ncbi:MAG: polyprenyl synthetase family protein [Actinomycetota bacterium]|nr:polyprenyl synthetase family protein [Actinomycetota bacterium]